MGATMAAKQRLTGVLQSSTTCGMQVAVELQQRRAAVVRTWTVLLCMLLHPLRRSSLYCVRASYCYSHHIWHPARTSHTARGKSTNPGQ